MYLQYAAMYQQYESRVLPPAAAIERQMEALVALTKQKERARLKRAVEASMAAKRGWLA